MPRKISEGDALTWGLTIRVPPKWGHQLDYLAELQGVRPAVVVRDLLQAGAEAHGLEFL